MKFTQNSSKLIRFKLTTFGLYVKKAIELITFLPTAYYVHRVLRMW